MGITAPDELIARGVLMWAALFGCISFEVFGQYGPDTFTQPQDLFEHQLRVLVETVGLGADAQSLSSQMTAPLVTVAPTSAVEAGDGAGLVGLERLLHLHRLEDDDDVALGDGLALGRRRP